MSEENIFRDMTEDELKDTIIDMSSQLREAKEAYREKRLVGVKLALEARKSADEDLSEELRKIGVSYRVRDELRPLGLTYRL
jgi:hypothetical protein|tara:strand:- start:68 stop:313 length:246 start_codon:yes stop_codon:yes gene_type:complete